MKQNVYVVVGQYNQKKNSSALNELIDCLKKLGEVNIFDMPTADSADSGEVNGSVIVHRYACPEKSIVNAAQRIPEIVRDLVHLGATEYYLDYGVEKEYQSIIKLINNALRNYGVQVYTLNRRTPFRWLRNLIWDIQFQLKEWKLQEQEEKEIEQVENMAGHGSMHGFVLYKKFETAREERKRIMNLRKHH